MASCKAHHCINTAFSRDIHCMPNLHALDFSDYCCCPCLCLKRVYREFWGHTGCSMQTNTTAYGDCSEVGFATRLDAAKADRDRSGETFCVAMHRTRKTANSEQSSVGYHSVRCERAFGAVGSLRRAGKRRSHRACSARRFRSLRGKHRR